MWVCPRCGANNEGVACWRCVPQAQAAWNPTPPPVPSRRRRWPLLLVAGVGMALLAVLALAVVRPVLRIGSTSVALAAPAAIDGLPKTGDFSTQPVTLFGRHLLDVASATYGSGDLHYAVVAVSGVGGSNARTVLQTLTPQIGGDDSVDASSTTHLARSGVDYTCSRMSGAAPGATCTWDADGVAGAVVQVGSADMARCADFADVARQAVRHGS